MTLSKVLPSVLLLAGLGLSACGGGGGGSVAGIGGGGIGGTGITSSGTIDGFGSIFVNGVEFETGASEVIVDGRAAGEGSLRLGMVVTVRGTLNRDGKTGTAEQVVFDDEIQGPVAAIEAGPDGDTLLLTVLGVKVIAERTGTVFDDVTFDTLAVGDVVEVSGFVDDSQRIRATRIEKQSIFEPGVSEVELKGVVSALTATTFTLDAVLVDYSNADLAGVPGATLAQGMPVEVHGTLVDDIIVATRVEQEDDITDGLDDDEELSVQGAITGYVSAANFTVDGVRVDASGAELEPAGLVLANGVVVEVEGVWNGSTLQAQEVKSRRGRVELEAKVAAVDAGTGSITLRYFTGTVTVLVDSRTQLDDETDQVDALALTDIAGGDFLQIEASQLGSELVASRVRREDADDDVLQGRVDSFTAGADITVLGITFSTAGAAFQGSNDNSVGAATFFAALQAGDLVKIRDEQQPDGVADEVEFEDEELDGNEPDDECDGDSAADEDCGPDDDDDCEDNSGSGGDCGPDDGDCEDSGGSVDDCEPDDDECDVGDDPEECEPDDDPEEV